MSSRAQVEEAMAALAVGSDGGITHGRVNDGGAIHGRMDDGGGA